MRKARSKTPVGAYVDTRSPVNWQNSVNFRLVGWWAGLTSPGWSGSYTYRNIVKRPGAAPSGTLNGFTSFVPTSGWTDSARCFRNLTFDGINDTVTISDSSGMQITNSFTIILGIRFTSTSQSQTYLFSKDSVSQWAIIYEYVDNTVEFFSDGYSGANPRTGSGILISDTNWHHIVYTYDGVTWAGYLDGGLVFSDARSFSLPALAGATTRISGSSVGNYVACSYSGVWLYQRGLLAQEIREHYHEWDMNFPTLLNWIPQRSYGFAAATPGGIPVFNASWCKNTNVVQSIGRGF